MIYDAHTAKTIELNTMARPVSMFLRGWFPVYVDPITTNPLRNIEKWRSITLSSLHVAGCISEAKMIFGIDVWNAFPVISYRRRYPPPRLCATAWLRLKAEGP